jgi:Rhodopirellula transposase DDE domain
MADDDEMMAARFAEMRPRLDESQWRALLGFEARARGHGGIRRVARAAGVAESTVSVGARELESGAEPLKGRVRKPGGGRKRLVETDPGLLPALLSLVEPEERGDPMGPLRWTTKSTRTLAEQLTENGHPVSPVTVGVVLRKQGFSLRANVKTLEGKDHPDRDAQFRYLNEQVQAHQDDGQPVLSVDAKKKENLGPYANSGRTWRPGGDPVQVRSHDFPDKPARTATPFGIYDLGADAGWVNVGTDHNTATFAVESIRRWWNSTGRHDYPDATRLLLTADAGGSNGHRVRTWKTELAALAAEIGLDIQVCHFPPGTSKWNKIEHRLFSHITMNWAGRPLTSHDVVVESIAATTTRTGLRVRAELDTNTYDLGIKISNDHFDALPLTRNDWHGDWNYTLHPTGYQIPEPTPELPAPTPADTTWLAHPILTGLTPRQWDTLLAHITAYAATENLTRPDHLTLPALLNVILLNHHTGLPTKHLAPLLGLSARALHTHTKPLREHLKTLDKLPPRGPHHLATLEDLYGIAAYHHLPTPATTP